MDLFPKCLERGKPPWSSPGPAEHKALSPDPSRAGPGGAGEGIEGGLCCSPELFLVPTAELWEVWHLSPFPLGTNTPRWA